MNKKGRGGGNWLLVIGIVIATIMLLPGLREIILHPTSNQTINLDTVFGLQQQKEITVVPELKNLSEVLVPLHVTEINTTTKSTDDSLLNLDELKV